MDLEILNPVNYPGWDELLLRSGDDSFFHTSGWAKVLMESYGYKPLYYSRIEKGEFLLLMPLMEITSILTGKRGVSLPFTDHCDPLAPDTLSQADLVKAVIDYGRRSNWAYAEMRITGDLVKGATFSESFLTHDINLERSEPDAFPGVKRE